MHIFKKQYTCASICICKCTCAHKPAEVLAPTKRSFTCHFCAGDDSGCSWPDWLNRRTVTTSFLIFLSLYSRRPPQYVIVCQYFYIFMYFAAFEWYLHRCGTCADREHGESGELGRTGLQPVNCRRGLHCAEKPFVKALVTAGASAEQAACGLTY